jgi:hypothetical protein
LVDAIDAIEEVREHGRGKKKWRIKGEKRTHPINCDPRAIAILSLK